MISKGTQYLSAAGFGNIRVTAASMGSLDILDTLGWLRRATKQVIMVAFGARDGAAVIAATNAYLNALAAQGAAGQSKATALAGFINEDPMMVCSLGLEVTGVTMPDRWIVGDKNSWIDTGWTATSNSVQIDIKFKCVTSLYYGYILFGSGTRNDTNWCINPYNYNYSNSTLRSYVGNSGEIDLQAITLNTIYRNIYTANNGSYSRETNGVVAKTATYTNTIINGQNLFIFADNAENRTLFMSDYYLAYLKINDANPRHFIPCKHNGVCGMYDIETKQFYGNAGTGQFTIPDISYTPSTP